MGKKTNIKNDVIDNIATLSKGYPVAISSKIKGTKTEGLNTLKILNISNIKELIDNEVVSYNTIEFQQKYNKEIQYVQKNDIVIATATGSKRRFNVFFIENEPKDKYCYSNSMFVIRVKDENIITSKYLYIQLLTDTIQNKLISLAKGNLILHIAKKDLLNVKIKIPTKNEMIKICNQYDEAIEYAKKSERILKEILK